MIPDYQSIMLPLLRMLSDKAEHTARSLVDRLAVHFNLSEEERKELLDSGQSRFDNRVGWAKTYMKKAGLLDSPKRGVLVISQRGLDALNVNPDNINVRYLKQFPEFIEFQKPRLTDSENHDDAGEEFTAETPEEILDSAYTKINSSLASELLNKVMVLPPSFFEKLVVELLVKMGYGGSIKDAGKTIGRTGDEGIDGTIKEDKLGLDIIYIQAKRWQTGNNVGRPDIQKFVGALAGQGAKKGIFITTSGFSKDAIDYMPKNETKIVLISGVQLAQLMIDYNLGVTVQRSFDLKKIDNDYFEEG